MRAPKKVERASKIVWRASEGNVRASETDIKAPYVHTLSVTVTMAVKMKMTERIKCN